MTLTIDILLDDEGHIAGVVVPDGAAVHITTEADPECGFEAHYSDAEDDLRLDYEREKDVGFLPHVPRGFRTPQGLAVHDLRKVIR